MKIELYTDGASKGNPGPGGYGAILKAGPHYKELSQGFRLTTNNRMELMAVIVGLEAIKKVPSEVLVVSDSKYVVDAINKGWLKNWIANHFRKAKNKDLWLRFNSIYSKHHVRMMWIKGHNEHPENERCDQLAVSAAMKPGLLIDKGYEDQESNAGSMF